MGKSEKDLVNELTEMFRGKTNAEKEAVSERLKKKYADKTFYIAALATIFYGSTELCYPATVSQDYPDFIAKLRDWTIRGAQCVADWEKDDAKIQALLGSPPTESTPIVLFRNEGDMGIAKEVRISVGNIETVLDLVRAKAASKDCRSQQELSDIRDRDRGRRAQYDF